MLVFSKKVRSAYKRGDFESLFVVGPQGSGKTTYAMLVLYELYHDWDTVLRRIVFDPKEILPRFKEALGSGRRLKLVVFDDAGIHLSKYLWNLGREGQYTVMLINSMFNVIRSVVAGVIFTSPDMDILVELRRKSWWVGQPKTPSGRDDPIRHMVLYRKTILPSGKIHVSKKAIDIYDLRLIPSDVRKEYEAKRREAMEPILKKLESVIGSVS